MDLPLFWISVLAPVVIAALMPSGRGLQRIVSYALAALFLLPAAAGLYYISYLGRSSVKDPISIDLGGIGTFSLMLDGLSLPVQLGISIVTAAVAIYSLRYMSHRIDEMRHAGVSVPGERVYFTLYGAFASSMIGMALSTNLIQFFIFLEISLLSSFALIAYYGYGDRLRIALMYFIWTHVGGALFLVGVLFYGMSAGSYDVFSQSGYSDAFLKIRLEGLSSVAPVLILAGLLVKMAIFGVHMWLPYAHAEAPTPISALLSPNLIGIAGYAIARFGISMFPTFMESISVLLTILAIISIIYGGLVALGQNDLKRFLAYSSISQMGYMLLGISTLTAFGVAGAMLHYLSHAIGKAILFMMAGVFITELGGLRDMSRMGGFAIRYPVMAAVSLLGFLHLVGVPPTIGIWGELMILLGFVEAYMPTSAAGLLAVSLALIASFMVTAVYSFSAMRRIFFGPPAQIEREKMDEFKITLLALAVVGIIMFIAAAVVLSPLRGATEVLLELMR